MNDFNEERWRKLCTESVRDTDDTITELSGKIMERAVGDAVRELRGQYGDNYIESMGNGIDGVVDEAMKIIEYNITRYDMRAIAERLI